jgi:hypothetical protein
MTDSPSPAVCWLSPAACRLSQLLPAPFAPWAPTPVVAPWTPAYPVALGSPALLAQQASPSVTQPISALQAHNHLLVSSPHLQMNASAGLVLEEVS